MSRYRPADEGVAQFLTPLDLRVLENRHWMLVNDLYFWSALYRGIVVAPTGMQTDLASIPRLLWTIFPKVGPHDYGAIIHDGGYGNMLLTENGDRIFTAKHVADNLFLEGMLANGTHPRDARLMYQAVKWWGDPQGHPLSLHRPEPGPLPTQPTARERRPTGFLDAYGNHPNLWLTEQGQIWL